MFWHRLGGAEEIKRLLNIVLETIIDKPLINFLLDKKEW